MDYKTFKREIQAYENNNVNLIEEYDSNALTPFCKMHRELYKNYVSYNELVKKCTIKAFLNTIISEAIERKCDIIDVSNKTFSKLYENKKYDELSDNLIQKYFDDVKKIYDKHNNNINVDFSEENRMKLIETNLKTVISVAKKFRGAGLPFEDLIQAGNCGLCKAFEKFDPSRSVVRDMFLSALKNVNIDILTGEQVHTLFFPLCKYGSLKKNILKNFVLEKEYSKEEIEKWINKNIKTARFNSVAVEWIRASIIDELNKYSRPIRKPKTEIDKELSHKSEDGENPYKDRYVFIDDCVSDGSSTTYAEILNVPDEVVDADDREEAMQTFKDGMKVLMKGVKTRDRRILMQKYGIGYPRQLTPKEISEKENLSVARICQIVNSTLERMKSNQEKYKLNPQIMFNCLQNMY